LTAARYFRITEISGDEFVHTTGEDLDCSQLVVPTGENVYVALDETNEDEMTVSLDSFDRGGR
jgi:hypothetical protein